MKVKIILISSHSEEKLPTTSDFEEIVAIKFPMSIKDSSEERTRIIDTKISKSISSAFYYETLIIEGFKEAVDFEAVCTALANSSLRLSSYGQVIVKHCAFSGSLYTGAVLHLSEALRKRTLELAFNITIQNALNEAVLSAEDKAKLEEIFYITLCTDNISNAPPFFLNGMIHNISGLSVC